MDRSPRTSNKYDYNNISAVKRALKNYLKLESKSQANGNYDALATLMDLRASMGFDSKEAPILTPRQQECITMCLVEDMTEVKAAQELGISQQSVFYSIRSGLRRIQKYLLTGETVKRVFTPEEETKLISMYVVGKRSLEISIVLNKSVKTIRNKIKYLRKRSKL